jgi:hypothetical protein
MDIMISDKMYTKLLKSILQNKRNLNVIIDKDKSYGFVFDKEKQYIKMDINDINEKSIQKIKDNLLEINNDLFKDIDDRTRIYSTNKDYIIDRHRKIIENESIKKDVNNFFRDIYNDKKIESKEIYNYITDTNENSNSSILDGY